MFHVKQYNKTKKANFKVSTYNVWGKDLCCLPAFMLVRIYLCFDFALVELETAC